MANKGDVQIDPCTLITKLRELESQCDGDLAHVVERLLLENHVLAMQQSSGLKRGMGWDFSMFPRFLSFDESSTPGSGD